MTLKATSWPRRVRANSRAKRCSNCNLIESKSATSGTTSKLTTSSRKPDHAARTPLQRLVAARLQEPSWEEFSAAAKAQRSEVSLAPAQVAEFKPQARNQTSSC